MSRINPDNIFRPRTTHPPKMSIAPTTNLLSPRIHIVMHPLFHVTVNEKNKPRTLHIPVGTQLVEKGRDSLGNMVYAFHLFENKQMKFYTTSAIPEAYLRFYPE